MPKFQIPLSQDRHYRGKLLVDYTQDNDQVEINRVQLEDPQGRKADITTMIELDPFYDLWRIVMEAAENNVATEDARDYSLVNAEA